MDKAAGESGSETGNGAAQVSGVGCSSCAGRCEGGHGDLKEHPEDEGAPGGKIDKPPD